MRTLADFLANRGHHGDDVLAKRYTALWLAEAPAPVLAKIVEKQVAHLTTVRLEKAQQPRGSAHAG